MKKPLRAQLLNAAASINLLLAAVVIAAAVSFGPNWPLDLLRMLSGGGHGR